jgi:CIC family chloride channel protein
VLTGIGAVVLRALIGLFHNILYSGTFSFAYNANVIEAPSRFGDLVFFSPIIRGLIVVFLVQRFAPEAKGHGVPEVMDAVLYNHGNIRGRVAVVKSLASALSIGSGASVGREGPIIQIGATLGSAFSQLLSYRLGRRSPCSQREPAPALLQHSTRLSAACFSRSKFCFLRFPTAHSFRS